ncbi:SacI homology domain-containing protein [Gongronella butleri]|nr:SacI homology domain-containing protein [Gongronella butleri]
MNQDAHMFQELQHLHEEQFIQPDEPAASTSTAPAADKPRTQPAADKESPSIPRTGNYAVMSHYELYETKTRYYLVGSDHAKQRFKVLQIHRTNPRDLVVIEDDVVYSQQEKIKLLGMIEDGNLSVGGLHPVHKPIYGIVGFVRFTQGWYMVVITKCKQVALLGGHYIYHIEATELIPIGYQTKIDRNSNTDEGRYITTFENIELTKNFYFSYTYDLSNTLQVNMTRMPGWDPQHTKPQEPNGMFVWNDYLLKTGFKNINARSGWILHLIYGFVDQAKISVFGRNIIITLIARRSRHFAGARFLKRGVNDKGYVANDVETEQIVAELATTSFHSHDQLYGNPHYSSYVQHRGSIPLFWSQDTTNMSPKPPIELTVVDPFFSAAALHFEDLFRRYGTPVIVLNLIKQKEKTERESILGKEFAEMITYLNQFLPDDKKIKYIAWDMSRASKSHDQDVIRYLEKIAQDTMASTSFFYTGSQKRQIAASRQHGVLRTNCIDCLDRTNAAQFLMGKCALGHQLHALGVINSPYMQFDSDAINIFTEMYHDHGDTIALQYGGSHLVNTMETYRKINQWTSHPRDAIETIRRYYANAFSDGEKQDAINLFLGNFVTKDGQPMLWELNSDYHLHNQDPRIKPKRKE